MNLQAVLLYTKLVPFLDSQHFGFVLFMVLFFVMRFPLIKKRFSLLSMYHKEEREGKKRFPLISLSALVHVVSVIIT